MIWLTASGSQPSWPTYDPDKSLTLYFRLRSTFQSTLSHPHTHSTHPTQLKWHPRCPGSARAPTLELLSPLINPSLPGGKFLRSWMSMTIRYDPSRPITGSSRIRTSITRRPPWSKIKHMASVLSPRLNSYVVILNDVQRKPLCDSTFKFPIEQLKWMMRTPEANRPRHGPRKN